MFYAIKNRLCFSFFFHYHPKSQSNTDAYAFLCNKTQFNPNSIKKKKWNCYWFFNSMNALASITLELNSCIIYIRLWRLHSAAVYIFEQQGKNILFATNQFMNNWIYWLSPAGADTLDFFLCCNIVARSHYLIHRAKASENARIRKKKSEKELWRICYAANGKFTCYAVAVALNGCFFRHFYFSWNLAL